MRYTANINEQQLLENVLTINSKENLVYETVTTQLISYSQILFPIPVSELENSKIYSLIPILKSLKVHSLNNLNMNQMRLL